MDDEIKLIEEYAGLFLTIEEIAVLIDADPTELRRDIRGGKSERSRAYNKGKLNSILEVRRQTVAFAKKGSPAAEDLVQGYIIKQAKNE